MPGRIWGTWKTFSAALGDFQSRIILMLFYFTIVAPFGLLVRLLGDPLNRKGFQQASAWPERPSSPSTLEEGRQQF
jgi:hypothetical protein